MSFLALTRFSVESSASEDSRHSFASIFRFSNPDSCFLLDPSDMIQLGRGFTVQSRGFSVRLKPRLLGSVQSRGFCGSVQSRGLSVRFRSRGFSVRFKAAAFRFKAAAFRFKAAAFRFKAAAFPFEAAAFPFEAAAAIMFRIGPHRRSYPLPIKLACNSLI